LHLPSVERESESSLRRRRSALELLIEIGIPQKTWPTLRYLVQDRDARVAMLACKVCLLRGSASQRHVAIYRLISLLSDADWTLRDEIEDCLVTHFDGARGIIAEYVQNGLSPHEPLNAKIKHILLRIQEHGDPMRP
jgi:hypothetical protein